VTSTNAFPAAPGMDVPFPDSALQQTDSTTPQPILEALNNIVLRSPSLLGRVIDIASCWNASAQKYENPLVAGADGVWADEALRKLHLDTFTNWLALSLRAQKRDLAVYLNRCDRGERPHKLSQLLRSAERSVPAGAMPEERELFTQDLNIVRALLQDEI
jgi:hypothetical protein